MERRTEEDGSTTWVGGGESKQEREGEGGREVREK